MSRMQAYAGIARAPFLLLPITLVIAGAGASHHAGTFNWLHSRRGNRQPHCTLVGLSGISAIIDYTGHRIERPALCRWTL